MDRVKGAVPLTVALLGAGVVVALLGFSSTLNPLDVLLGRGAIVTVPDLVGRPQPGAEAELRSEGLVANVRTSYSLAGARGSVIAQDPPAGSRLREGKAVTIVVSRGVNRVEMPDAVGRPLRQVRAPLDDAGVKVALSRVHSEDVADGVVISQDPGPGVVVSGEDKVTFVVSKGPADRAVPDVRGLDLEGAAFLLGKAGMAIGAVNPTDDSSAPVGSVLATDPPAGEVVARDTVVTLAQAAGTPPVALPDVMGRTADEASAAMTQLGLVPNVIRLGGIDAVTAQEPPAPTPLRPGQVVTLRVGGGA